MTGSVASFFAASSSGAVVLSIGFLGASFAGSEVPAADPVGLADPAHFEEVVAAGQLVRAVRAVEAEAIAAKVGLE